MYDQLYRTLGLMPGASLQEVSRAFKQLAMKHHPDRQGGDEKKFKEISAAYTELKKQLQGAGPSSGPAGSAGGGGGDQYQYYSANANDFWGFYGNAKPSWQKYAEQEAARNKKRQEDSAKTSREWAEKIKKMFDDDGISAKWRREYEGSFDQATTSTQTDTKSKIFKVDLACPSCGRETLIMQFAGGSVACVCTVCYRQVKCTPQ